MINNSERNTPEVAQLSGMKKNIGMLAGAIVLLVGPLMVSIHTLMNYADSATLDWKYYG